MQTTYFGIAFQIWTDMGISFFEFLVYEMLVLHLVWFGFGGGAHTRLRMKFWNE